MPLRWRSSTSFQRTTIVVDDVASAVTVFGPALGAAKPFNHRFVLFVFCFVFFWLWRKETKEKRPLTGFSGALGGHGTGQRRADVVVGLHQHLVERELLQALQHERVGVVVLDAHRFQRRLRAELPVGDVVAAGHAVPLDVLQRLSGQENSEETR